MKIGELSSRTGVSIRMLRYYEQKGLLNPSRSESGYRRYGVEDVQRIKDIALLNGAGLPLAAIRDLLACVPSGANPAPLCYALKSRIREQLEQIDRQIASLNKSRQRLTGLLR
ncbi:MerR family transcriptional regulator [Brenneria rubrifaciens]|uniref:MerR family transcriptional regulator n=1 Tax=Brenneria rubrifaciens TaxID=55213 RepID=A0A4P8QMK7_9GAMM|nr:MerR family transcriptional regulator [Brenneria rubrifaciens]QCR08148.1 MerR family transcriptional regulator [Brenneria rubrifaciens]QCR09025.1 MerR family transcriptional regulator [Brenneria rubrifaciens]